MVDERRSLVGQALRAVPSVAIGAFTHVISDSFTHDDRWGTRHVGALSAVLGTLPLYTWLQFGSGVFGLAAVAVWIGVALHRAPPTPLAPPARSQWDQPGISLGISPRLRHGCWIVALVLVTAAAVAGWLGAAAQEGRLLDERTVVAAVTRAVSALLGLVLAFGFGYTVASAVRVLHSRARARV